MSSKRVLITGSTGFIGQHLARYLADGGYEVHILSRSPLDDSPYTAHTCALTDTQGLSRIFEEVQPEFLVHLAARAMPSRNLDDFALQYSDTILPSMTLARVAPPSLKLALFFGSCEEYGNGPTPFREEQALHTFSPYGWGKISAFHGTSSIAESRGVPWCWARPFLSFGPGQKSEQLIPALIRGCLAGTSIPLSPGEQTRDFVYIEDLCLMVGRLLSEPEKARGQILNLCSGNARTVRSVAETVHAVVGRGRLDLGALPYRSNEAMSFYGSNEKYTDLFGAPVLTPFADAIAKTVESYRL